MLKNNIYETNDDKRLVQVHNLLPREQSFSPANMYADQKITQVTESEDLDCVADNESSRESNKMKNQLYGQNLMLNKNLEQNQRVTINGFNFMKDIEPSQVSNFGGRGHSTASATHDFNNTGFISKLDQ